VRIRIAWSDVERVLAHRPRESREQVVGRVARRYTRPVPEGWTPDRTPEQVAEALGLDLELVHEIAERHES